MTELATFSFTGSPPSPVSTNRVSAHALLESPRNFTTHEERLSTIIAVKG